MIPENCTNLYFAHIYKSVIAQVVMDCNGSTVVEGRRPGDTQMIAVLKNKVQFYTLNPLFVFVEGDNFWHPKGGLVVRRRAFTSGGTLYDAGIEKAGEASCHSERHYVIPFLQSDSTNIEVIANLARERFYQEGERRQFWFSRRELPVCLDIDISKGVVVSKNYFKFGTSDQMNYDGEGRHFLQCIAGFRQELKSC